MNAIDRQFAEQTDSPRDVPMVMRKNKPADEPINNEQNHKKNINCWPMNKKTPVISSPDYLFRLTFSWIVFYLFIYFRQICAQVCVYPFVYV